MSIVETLVDRIAEIRKAVRENRREDADTMFDSFSNDLPAILGIDEGKGIMASEIDDFLTYTAFGEIDKAWPLYDALLNKEKEILSADSVQAARDDGCCWAEQIHWLPQNEKDFLASMEEVKKQAAAYL